MPISCQSANRKGYVKRLELLFSDHSAKQSRHSRHPRTRLTLLTIVAEETAIS